MYKILIIDDDESSRESLSSYLTDIGYEIMTAASGESGYNLFKKFNADLIISDIKMPGMSGLDLLKKVKDYDSLVQVIIITAFDDMNSTICAMQLGAYDYIEKPIDIIRLTHTIKRALENRDMSIKLEYMAQGENSSDFEFKNTLIGRTSLMREIYKKIGQASSSYITVLIQGESGTGKELIARIIHSSGITKDEPFIAINCTAIPENLLESELFGHVKGAFTDAIKDKKGKFELAGNGTIFLDEISEMSTNLQAKLLRVLQEKVFEKVGGESLIPMRARVIAATNSNLERLVTEKKFRQDLFYRLSVFTIYPPPLRERKEDIEMLVKFFLKKINMLLHKNVNKVPDDVIKMLVNHEWYGNVRELENTLMQAVVMSKSDVLEKENILLKSLIPATKGEEINNADDALMSLDDVEKNHIEKVLKTSSWNVMKACSILKVSKATLYRKMELYSLKKLQ